MPVVPAPPQAVTARSTETGMAIMVLAMLIVPATDAISKTLTSTLNPIEIAFWRLLLQAALMGLIAALLRKRIWGAPPGWLLVGGTATAVMLSALYGAFMVMPLATAIAIFFVEPLVLTMLSALVLKEPVGPRRYVAVFVGLLGALIIVRPSFDLFGWRALLPLLAATGFATTALSMRRLSSQLGPVAIQFWLMLIASSILGVGLLVSGRMSLFSFAGGIDTGGPWPMLGLLGSMSALGYFLIADAFRRVPASTLAPFQYLEIIGATAWGYFIFGNFPDWLTWLGTAIILGSGLYVFHRERRLSRS